MELEKDLLKNHDDLVIRRIKRAIGREADSYNTHLEEGLKAAGLYPGMSDLVEFCKVKGIFTTTCVSPRVAAGGVPMTEGLIQNEKEVDANNNDTPEFGGRKKLRKLSHP